MADLNLFVRPGEELTPALWDAMVKAVRSLRILFGNGIRGRRTPNGTTLSCSLWAPWPHPFPVSVSGDVATIGKGTVDGIEPTIDDIPISGTDENPQPTLNLSSPKFNDDGLGWIALEVTVDDAKFKTVSSEVVQVSSLGSGDSLKARQALALLVKRGDGSFDTFQIAYFNYQHVAYKGNGVLRHFFFPA